MGSPFADLGTAGVCARVALALIRRERTKRLPIELRPPILIGCTVERFRGLQLDTVRLACLSLSVWVVNGGSSQGWLKDVCYRDLLGYDIRRCFYSEYKGTRRNPRVTNRGVRAPLPLPDASLPPHSLLSGTEAPND